MKRFWILSAWMMCIGLTTSSAWAQKKEVKTQTVVFLSEIDCKSCQVKIEKNIPFEKGVKALKVSLEQKRVEVEYRTDKTTPEQLRLALEKLGYVTSIQVEAKP